MERFKKIGKVLFKLFIGILLLFLLLFSGVWLVLKVPRVQNYLVQKATHYISDKTHTRVELKEIGLAFPKSLMLEGVFLEDKRNDTLVYAQTIEIDIQMLGLLNKEVNVGLLRLSGVNAQLKRSVRLKEFNFQFLIDAFATKSPQEEAKKDTTAAPWKIDVKELAVDHFRFGLQDSTGSLFLKTSLGQLKVELNELDLVEKNVDIKNVLLSDFHVDLIKTKPVSLPDTSTSGNGWNGIQLRHIVLERSHFKYQDKVLDTKILALIGKLGLEEGNIQLAQQQMAIRSFDLLHSTAALVLTKDTVKQRSSPSSEAKDVRPWTLEAQYIRMHQNQIKLDYNGTPVQSKGIDYNHLHLKDFSAKMNHVFFKGNTLQALVSDLAVQEKSGFGIRSLAASIRMDSSNLVLKQLKLATNHSILSNTTSLSYPSMDRMMTEGSANVALTRSQLSPKDLLYFAPDLAANEWIAKNIHQRIGVNMRVSGTMEKLVIQEFDVQTGKGTRLDIGGIVQHPSQTRKLQLNLQLKEFKTTSQDVIAMVPSGTIPPSLHMPARMALRGSFKGSLSNFNTKMSLVTSEGQAHVSGSVKDLQSASPTYNLEASTSHAHLGHLLGQSGLGKLNANVRAHGKGFDKRLADAEVEVEVQSVGYQQYTYRNIHLNSQIKQGLAQVRAAIEDSNVAMKMNGRVGFLPSKESIQLSMHLLGIDLYRLGLHKEHIQVSARSELDFKGTGMSDLNGFMDIRDILIVKNNKEYRIDSLVFASVNDPKGNNLSLQSTLLTAKFNGNMDAGAVGPTLLAHLNRYFAFQGKQPTKTKPQNFEFEMAVNESPIIREVILPSLTFYKTLVIHGGFDSSKDKFWVDLKMPKAIYADNQLEGLHVQLDSDKEKMTYDLGFASFQKGSVQLNATSLNGQVAKDTAHIHLYVADTLEKHKLSLKSFLTKKDDLYHFAFRPDGLSLENQAWKVDKHNFVEFGNGQLFVNQLAIFSNTQAISAQSTGRDKDADLVIGINNLNLHTLSQIAERKDSLVRGEIDGEVVLQDYQAKSSFTSNLTFTNLAFKTSEIGTVDVKADNLTANRITLHASVEGHGNNIRMGGYYRTNDADNALDFKVDVQALQLASFESLSGKQISRSSGALKGNLHIVGKTSKPTVLGELTFDEVHTEVAYLNSYLYFKNETIHLTEEGVRLDRFTIRDTLGNTAVIHGAVRIPSYDDVRFDLDLVSENFLVLNTTAVDNKLYYGTIILDSEIHLDGSPNLPKVNARINLAKGSRFTFAVPESKVTIDKGEGVMEFVFEPEDMHPIMMRREYDKLKTASFTGLDVNAKVKVHDHTALKILMDPYSGDSLVVRGNADVNFGIDPSGKISLSGIYTLTDGKYKAYIENITSKEFALVKDSKIIWNGDPLDAQVDLMAKYRVRTSSSELMTIGGGMSTITDSSALRRPLLYDVYLVMQGELLKPKISFKLDMPENQRSEGGGVIYAKVTELNANEAELNKQVFSLLVLNKFMSAIPNGGGGGGISGFARSSVSRIMSDQINQLSSQYLKGVEVNVDVQSYNYTQGGKSQANTQVNVGVKKSFDRLTVQVGSNVRLQGKDAQRNNVNNLTGDVQVGYRLTEDGRYQLKGFRQNQVDNVVNGVITETGVGVAYSRDYNQTKELFTRPKKTPKLKRNE